MSSFICFKMPTISLLPPKEFESSCERKLVSVSLSLVLMSMDTESCCKTAASAVCRNELLMPSSMAGIALLSASMFLVNSAASLVADASSSERMAVAFAMASLASASADFAAATSAVSCVFLAASSLMLEDTTGILSSAVEMEVVSLAEVVLQSHMNLSNIFWFSSPSSVTFVCIFCNKFTTFLIGFPWLVNSTPACTCMVAASTLTIPMMHTREAVNDITGIAAGSGIVCNC
mmetsp:Transcript_77205/g.136754  ORF Transcript_77205/g.136754 Transcript_77205/m.136754 type:complete len:233 (+) Transcript_77205:1472-2170(+)